SAKNCFSDSFPHTPSKISSTSRRIKNIFVISPHASSSGVSSTYFFVSIFPSLQIFLTSGSCHLSSSLTAHTISSVNSFFITIYSFHCLSLLLFLIHIKLFIPIEIHEIVDLVELFHLR